LIEHLKQHMTLWYLNRSNGYVQQANKGKPVDNYDDPKLTSTIDQLYTTVGAHVTLDVKEVFQQFIPAFQQLIQQAQQRAQSAKSNLPPDAQVVHDTSMAETQRKTQKDQADIAYDQAKLAAENARHADDNQTKIEIENAKLTHETIQHANQMAVTPPPAAPAVPEAQLPQPEGALNGNV